MPFQWSEPGYDEYCDDSAERAAEDAELAPWADSLERVELTELGIEYMANRGITARARMNRIWPPVELELPECGYWIECDASGLMVVRSVERVCLGRVLDGRMVEVQGPVGRCWREEDGEPIYDVEAVWVGATGTLAGSEQRRALR